MLQLLLLALVVADASTGSEPAAEAPTDSIPREKLIERGDDLPPIYLPLDEELVFEATVHLGALRASVGQVTMSARVEPYRAPLLGRGKERGDANVLTMSAKGEHALYTLDSEISTRRQPVAWPSIVWRDNQRGSEEHRRELLIGRHGDALKARYRRDTEDGAPKGTRIWAEPELREVPDHTLDMISAIYLARTIIREDRETLELTLLDKLRLWEVEVTRGERKDIETPVGNFDAQELLLKTRRHPSDINPDKDGFSGPFGLRGTMHLWVESHSGVPVLIQGDLPAGPFELGVDIRLQRYAGTPEGFVAR